VPNLSITIRNFCIAVRGQVKADKAKIAALKTSSAGSIAFPYAVNTDDHCETGADAYTDVAPLLALLAAQLGKEPAALRVYDPYYCAGAVKRHLGAQGFHRVYNECEDFYQRVKEASVPPHDVLV
jgi:hypothetical protein